ncbi:MAG: acyl-ACP thioesterase [Deltaproteobacteria bacterium]|jgi:acyl-ACP thioesterase|nr:acyl-ACP thioesterase [Deltaproteobacteria bacterium]
MKNYFDRHFKLRFFEMNKYGMASPTTILTLLEETAADHCYDIGYSLYSLEKKNIGWILISGTINMIRYPVYRENILIRTWISRYSLVKGYRENIIFDDSGAVIGKAKGIWAFYDIEKRRPVPIFDEIKLKWGINTEISQEIDLGMVKLINTNEYQAEYNVYKSDVDSNKHVNNIKYFHWLIESLPDEILDNYILKIINAKFISEGKYGEKVQIYIEHENAKNTFLHIMKSSINNKILAAAHTTWEKI